MFLLFPINTDAPIYHRPWLTVSLIAANIVTFVITGGGWGETAESWMLEYGNGLHPLEWVSCNFLHFGIMHLVGNMIFLWGFGLVVEGKLGWWKYLLVYFGIGIGHAMIEQLIMLGSDNVAGSGGASGVIYGLLAMSLVWAPKNDVSIAYVIFFIIFFRFGVFEVTILTFGLFYIGQQFLVAWFLLDFQMSSEVIHLLGALVGFVVAAAMLKLNWVDCENWDLFAVLDGTYGNRSHFDSYVDRNTVPDVKSQKKKTRFLSLFDPPAEFATGRKTPAASKSKLLARMRELLENGKPNAALAQYQKLKHLAANWQLEEPDLRSLAQGLYQARSWPEAVPLLEEYLERFPDRSARFRLMLAGILIEIQKRPRYALRVLDALPPEPLEAKLQKQRTTMERIAGRLIEEGVIELDGQAWS